MSREMDLPMCKCVCVSACATCSRTNHIGSLGGTFQLNLLQMHLISMQTEKRILFLERKKTATKCRKISGSKSIKHRSLHTSIEFRLSCKCDIIFVCWLVTGCPHQWRSRTLNEPRWRRPRRQRRRRAWITRHDRSNQVAIHDSNSIVSINKLPSRSPVFLVLHRIQITLCLFVAMDSFFSLSLFFFFLTHWVLFDF